MKSFKMVVVSALLMSLGGNLFAADDPYELINFDLKNMPGSKCLDKDGAVINIQNTLEDPKFWSKLTAKDKDQRLQREDDVIYFFPKDDSKVEENSGPTQTLGMSEKDALKASRDNINYTSCSPGHDQGDMANRWCHSAISRHFSSFLEKLGASKTLSSIAGGVFWLPKEYFYDLNPSAGDLVVTYQDKLGTKRTTFEVTMFGDALYPKRPGQNFAPFKSSTPFFTIRRKLGKAN